MRQNIDKLVNQFGLMSLSVTERCNLRCKYCVYSGAYIGRRDQVSREHDMTWETAHAALDYFLDHLGRQFSQPQVNFYGGEPWLNWPLIRRCVAYLEDRSPKSRFGATTNGTLLSDELADYVAEHDFNLFISLDGPRVAHDRNRINCAGHGSFDRIWSNIVRLHRRHPEYYARSVHFLATLETGSDYESALAFFIGYPDLFAPGQVRFGSVLPLESVRPMQRVDEAYVRLIERFRAKLIAGETEDRESKFLQSIFDGAYQRIHRRNVSMRGLGRHCHCSGSCFPGYYRLFVRTDGVLQMCEKLNDKMTIGNVLTGVDVERVLDIYGLFSRLYDNDHCRNCWAIRFCDECFTNASWTDGQFDTILHDERCERNREYWKRHLISYCTLVEENHSSFDYLNNRMAAPMNVPALELLCPSDVSSTEVTTRR